VNKNDAQAVRADYKHGFAVCAAVAVDIGGSFVADGCAMAKDLES
jgi:hypothetical protein